jgi:hypothetical protein
MSEAEIQQARLDFNVCVKQNLQDINKLQVDIDTYFDQVLLGLNTKEDFKSKIIKDINEDLNRLDDHELGKVYKFIRTNIIANIKG